MTVHGGPGIVFHIDVFKVRNEANVLESLFVLLDIFVGLRGTLVIVEGYAWRNDIEHHRALVRDRSLQHGAELPLVARE